MNQKGCEIAKKNIQNWRNIYVLLFKTKDIMASCCFFHSYQCQGIQTKNSFDEIFNLNFDLGTLKMNTYCVKRNQFCKRLYKKIINEKKLMGEKSKRI
jgi:hypothetical protein